MTREGKPALIMLWGFESTLDVTRWQLAIKCMCSPSIPKICNECRDIPDDPLHMAPNMKTKRLLPSDSTFPLLLYMTRAKESRASVVIKIWPASRWWHASKLSRVPPDIHNSQSLFWSLRHIWHSCNCSPSRRHFRPEIAFPHSESFTTLKPFTV